MVRDPRGCSSAQEVWHVKLHGGGGGTFPRCVLGQILDGDGRFIGLGGEQTLEDGFVELCVSAPGKEAVKFNEQAEVQILRLRKCRVLGVRGDTMGGGGDGTG